MKQDAVFCFDGYCGFDKIWAIMCGENLRRKNNEAIAVITLHFVMPKNVHN